MTTGEIAAHFDDVYGATVSKETISTIPPSTGCREVPSPTRFLPKRRSGPSGRSTRCIRRKFVDAIHVKVRDGQVTNRPVYVAIGVTVDAHRDIVGL